ncbi:protein draper-like [Haliotis rufescens]|uniref:protein draper-like n=1 Tax=Haliotis rufescens TaxID=6454 RepID=UPI00201E9841|nr:protein draper-like [Haliotis rufescens]
MFGSMMLPLFQLLLPFSVAVQDYTVCEWGLYGEHCNLTCSQNCALLPPLDVPYCDTDTGKCSEGCQRGWHGDLCNQDCSRNCLEHTCNHQTGHCTLGCSGTNTGHFCNDTRDCGHGWYGDLCQHPCSINCLEERCNHATGACILGCSGTYTGEFCNTTKVVNNKEDANSLTDKQVAVALNVATVVGVTVTLTVSVIVYLRWRRRKNSSQGPDVEKVLMKRCNDDRKVKDALETCGRVTLSGGGKKTRSEVWG